MTDDVERPMRKRENTRSRLLEAAAAVFSEIGVAAASVEMITERAGFTRGAFYSNFESKDDLFFELMQSATERKFGAVTDRVRRLDEAGLQNMPLAEVLSHILDAVADAPTDIRLMAEFRLRAMRDERTAQAYLQWQDEMEGRMRELVEDVARGTGITLEVDAAALAQSVFYIWEGASVRGAIEARGETALSDGVRCHALDVISATVFGALTARGADQS